MRALDAIERLALAVAPEKGLVCDLFAGSGVVSATLAQHFGVIASDIQEYSRVLTNAQLNPALGFKEEDNEIICESALAAVSSLRTPAVDRLIALEDEAISEALRNGPERLASLLEVGSLAANHSYDHPCHDILQASEAELRRNSRTTIALLYGGLYFSFRQALEIDALIEAIRNLPASWRDTALAALLSTTSELASTIGNQFAQPIKPRTKDGTTKATLVKKVARRRLGSAIEIYPLWLQKFQSINRTGHTHLVTREDFRDRLSTLPPDVKLIYADPPYTRDHYSRFYHVLETLSRMDTPTLSTTTRERRTITSRVGYRSDRHQSPFSIASQVEAAFELLFTHAARLDAPLMISYSPSNEGTVARPKPRLMNIDGIVGIGHRLGFAVEVVSAGDIAHSKFNQKPLNSSVGYDAEVLIIATP